MTRLKESSEPANSQFVQFLYENQNPCYLCPSRRIEPTPCETPAVKRRAEGEF